MSGDPSVGGDSVCRFGKYELDRTTLELRKSGRRLKLAPQPARLLDLLASRPGELVTHEEIRSELWGEQTFVNFERSLNNCLNRIRAVLGDDPRAPHYIETLPRRGYRFVHDVVEAPTPAERSLAVLPFENLNHDPEQEFLADGMADVLMGWTPSSPLVQRSLLS